MNTLFSSPLPDEHIYSVVCRYHKIYGGRRANDTLIDLFGTRRPDIAAPIPIGIGSLRRKLNIASQSEWERMIDSTTLLPLFALWRQPELRESQYEAVSHKPGPYRKTLISKSRGWAAFRGSLRFCRACIVDDLHQNGVAYWHRSHQVPFVASCHRHNTPLYLHTLHKTTSGYLLPLSLPCEASRIIECNTPALHLHRLSAARLQARRLADFTHGLLCNSTGLNLANIGAACRYRLGRLNFSVQELENYALTKAAKRYTDCLEGLIFDELIELSVYWMFSGESMYKFALTDIVILTFLFRTFETLKATAASFTNAAPLERFNETRTELHRLLNSCVYERQMSCQQISEYLKLELIDVWCLLRLSRNNPTESWSDDFRETMSQINSKLAASAAIGAHQ